MIDITGGNALSLDRAAKLFPPARGGKTLNVITLTRWITRGVRGAKLEAVRVSGRWYTDADAIRRFVAESNSPPPQAMPAAPSKAGAALRALGF